MLWLLIFPLYIKCFLYLNFMITSIQYLRFFACISVVLFHITTKTYPENNFYLGATGVDIFFIISGFIMAYISNKREFNGVLFIKNRILRIYPIYIITLIPFICIFLYSPEIVNTNSGTPSILKSITLYPLITGSYLNLVSWTLSFEFYFYIIFAMSLNIKRFSIEITSFLIILFCILGEFFDVDFIKSTLVIEFIFGMFIYKFLYINKKDIPLIFYILFITLGISLLALLGQKVHGGPDYYRILFWGIPSLMIFIGFLFSSNQIKDIKWLVFLGDASYSIYLTHILSINIIFKILKRYNDIPNMNIFINVIAVIFSIIIGSLTYSLIEKPVTRFLKSLFIQNQLTS